jgi:hypothetical protein
MGLVALGVGVGTGAIAAGEGGSTFLGTFGAEFGAEDTGARLGIMGGLGIATGGAIVKKGC